ncbi:MAG: metal ABC transporter ATP-binding protein [Thermoprotei archaeon]|nr:MAG: metal ABC transporter ATP-binding protein [Thermoprotei archaeon]RLF21005.1 MAG: metal ABC transporter ATP-binding protein [Thermoprotei archaeon]
MEEHNVVLKDITVMYDSEVILKDLTVEFKGPGLIQVLGPNGAGKTTLFRTILGLVRPVRGEVIIDGEDVTGNPLKAGALIGYVPQLAFNEREEYPVSAWEYVLMSRQLHKRWPRLKSKDDVQIVKMTLEMVGLEREAWNKSLWELSGGQRQRVLIARALVHNPPILLMDEPLSSIDPIGKVELAELIGKIAKYRLVVVATHDPTLLLPYTKEVLLLNRQFYMMGTPDEVLKLESLRIIYGDAAIHLSEHVHISDSHYR